jgi:uncharacterized membrane protein
MESRAKLFGHSIHQQLIPFPLGLLFTAVVFDVIHLITGDTQWGLVSFWMIAAGVVGGLMAAPFGFIDWTAIPAGTRAKRVGAVHGLGNVVVVGLFGASWLLRNAGVETNPGMLPLVLSFAGGGLSDHHRVAGRRAGGPTGRRGGGGSAPKCAQLPLRTSGDRTGVCGPLSGDLLHGARVR